MKYLTFFILLLSLFICSCSEDDNPVESNNDVLKKEAEDFSLNVINCYFTQDTTSFRSYLSELLYMIDPVEPPYETSKFILSHYLSSYNYSDFTLDNYKDTYDYYIIDYDTYSKDFEGWVTALDYWHPSKNDFFFFGFELKEDKSPFMSSKPLLFMVSKSSGEWKLKAIQ